MTTPDQDPANQPFNPDELIARLSTTEAAQLWLRLGDQLGLTHPDLGAVNLPAAQAAIGARIMGMAVEVPGPAPTSAQPPESVGWTGEPPNVAHSTVEVPAAITPIEAEAEQSLPERMRYKVGAMPVTLHYADKTGKRLVVRNDRAIGTHSLHKDQVKQARPGVEVEIMPSWGDKIREHMDEAHPEVLTATVLDSSYRQFTGEKQNKRFDTEERAVVVQYGAWEMSDLLDARIKPADMPKQMIGYSLVMPLSEARDLFKAAQEDPSLVSTVLEDRIHIAIKKAEERGDDEAVRAIKAQAPNFRLIQGSLALQGADLADDDWNYVVDIAGADADDGELSEEELTALAMQAGGQN